ncbi:MAG: helix-turn-helix transcriptional regulator [Myxococcota bacterium]|nr:helix-turn-helix transcriptional regulator [Myxococcota bacterium]
MAMSRAVAVEPVSFGEWLRSQRVQRGLSQAWLAEAIGVSGSLLSRVENGEKSLSLESLAKLGRQLGLEARRVQLRAGVLAPEVLGVLQGHPEEFLQWLDERDARGGEVSG